MRRTTADEQPECLLTEEHLSPPTTKLDPE
jgi:hypothetical protein